MADDRFPNCENFSNQLTADQLHTEAFTMKTYIWYFVTELDVFKKYFTDQAEELKQHYAMKMTNAIGYRAVNSLTTFYDVSRSHNFYVVKKHKEDINKVDYSKDISEIFELVKSGIDNDVIAEKLKLVCNDAVLKFWIMTAKSNHEMLKELILNVFANRFPEYKDIKMPNIEKAKAKTMKKFDPNGAHTSIGYQSAQKNVNEEVDRQFEDQINGAMDKLAARYSKVKEKCPEASFDRVDKVKTMLEEKLVEVRKIPKPSYAYAVIGSLPKRLSDASVQSRVEGYYVKTVNEAGQRVFELMLVENLELDLISLQVELC